MLWLPQMRDAEKSEGAELDPVEVHVLKYYPYRTFQVCIKRKQQNNCSYIVTFRCVKWDTKQE